MNGIEILSSTTIYNTILPPWSLFIGLICITIGSVVGAISCSQYGDYKKAIASFIIVGIGIFFFVASLVENKNSINCIKHKVIIDDSVSMNEFLDKYEILDQEGKIYTIKERE